MIKHIGRHNQKKVVLLFREVPDEDHMCLITYSDTLPRLYHDEIMKVLESDAGQQAQNFADALFRSYMPDGTNALNSLHANGYIKKVPCNQVIITPNARSTVRLDELNKLLNEMSKGEQAVKRLAEIDNNKGLVEPGQRKKASRDLGEPVSSEKASVPQDMLLTDSDLAQQRLHQARRMQADADRLLKEAEVLLTEAKQLDPSLDDANNNTTTTKKKSTSKAKKS